MLPRLYLFFWKARQWEEPWLYRPQQLLSLRFIPFNLLSHEKTNPDDLVFLGYGLFARGLPRKKEPLRLNVFGCVYGQIDRTTWIASIFFSSPALGGPRSGQQRRFRDVEDLGVPYHLFIITIVTIPRVSGQGRAFALWEALLRRLVTSLYLRNQTHFYSLATSFSVLFLNSYCIFVCSNNNSRVFKS